LFNKGKLVACYDL